MSVSFRPNHFSIVSFTMLTFKYSTNLAKKAVKCSARLILPGTASFRISSGRTGFESHCSSSLATSCSCKPCTSFWYSSCSLVASVFLILMRKCIPSVLTCFQCGQCRTHSSIFSVNVCTLLAAASSMGLVRSTLKDSIQTLSILCASSNTTIEFLSISFDTCSATLGSSR